MHQCERKLQDFVSSLASNSTEIIRPEWHLADILHDQQESSEFHQNDVVVIDPLKCYESSDDEHDTSNEIQRQSELYSDTLAMTPVQQPMPVQQKKRPAQKQQRRPNNDDFRPLLNVSFCKYCEAPFIHRNECEAHENTHDPSLPYVCNFCPFRGDDPVNFIGHIRLCHDAERPYFCTKCNKQFGRRTDLRKHGVSHTGIRPFSCPICGKAFSRKTNVTNHMKVHEGKKGRTNKAMVASGKGQSPIKQQHPKIAFGIPDGAYPSMIGFPQFPSQNFQSNQFATSSTENAIYSKCAVKSEPLKLKLKLKKPFQAATASRKFECTTCKKAFKTKRDLDRHSQIHTGKKFRCSICQKEFARRDKLVRHEKIHGNRNKALPESAFLPENLKRSHVATEYRATATTASGMVDKQPPFTMDTFRPQFYAEYDLSETNN